MYTYEEISEGLECCKIVGRVCTKCPYEKERFPHCVVKLKAEMDEREMGASSPGAVEDMARENTELLQKIKQLEQERDAMIESLRKSKACCVCANRNTRNPNKNTYDITAKCIRCVCGESQFEWRGVCEENGRGVE